MKTFSFLFFFFFFWRPSEFGRKKRLNFRFRPKIHSQFWWRPFFFFFLETTWIWAKKTFEFPISAEKLLSILVKTSEFLRFCASNPPPTKIFWIRHWSVCCTNRRVARIRNGGLCLGLGNRASSSRRLMGVWGQSPQRSKILHFFAKIT